MDLYGLLGTLLAPNLWWLWELVIVIQYLFLQWIKPMGKTLCIPLAKYDSASKIWFAGKPVWVNPRKRNGMWSRNKGEGHRIESDKTAYIQTGFVSFPVEFFNTKKTRPMIVSFDEIDNSDDKTKGKPRNPPSDSFDEFALQNGFEQKSKANKKSKTDLGMVLLAAIAAGAIAFMVGYLYHPAACPPNFICTIAPNAIPSNGAITSTINSTIATTHQLLQNITSSSSR